MRGLQRFLIFWVGFSIPFNNVAFSFAGRNWSVGLVISALYFMTMLIDLPKITRIANYGKYIHNLIWFALLLTCMNLLNVNYDGTPVFPLTLFMCCLLFYTILLHSRLDSKAIQKCLSGFTMSCILLSILFVSGNGVEIGEDRRLSMFGENSNALGIYTCLGAIIIFNEWILKDKLSIGGWRFIFMIPYLLVVLLMFATGSRVSFFSYALSFIVGVAFFQPRAIRRKYIVIIVSVLIAFILYLLSQKADFVIFQRLLESAKEGDVSGREKILSELLPYVKEHLLLGVGQTGYVDISRQALGKIFLDGSAVYGFSPHNVLVEILLYTGIWGLILYMRFWWRLIKASISNYNIEKDTLPILLLIPVIGCVLSGQILTAKWAYIIYAYIIVSASNIRTGLNVMR